MGRGLRVSILTDCYAIEQWKERVFEKWGKWESKKVGILGNLETGNSFQFPKKKKKQGDWGFFSFPTDSQFDMELGFCVLWVASSESPKY